MSKMEITKVQCPECGETIRLTFKDGKCKCRSCDTTFEVGTPAIW